MKNRLKIRGYFFSKVILKMYFWGSNLFKKFVEYVFFEGAIFKILFENAFFERVTFFKKVLRCI